jgi:hypothetical protein
MVVSQLAVARFWPLSTQSRPLTVTIEFRDPSFGFSEEKWEILISFRLACIADESLWI